VGAEAWVGVAELGPVNGCGCRKFRVGKVAGREVTKM
jgi:hypothetical protein